MGTIVKKTKRNFNIVFPASAPPLIVRSPGRINLIGEHTDYNGGFVLPAAIDKAVYVAMAKRNDKEIQLYAADYKQSHMVSIDTVAPTDKHWPNYILGVVDQLQNTGYSVGGFNLLIDGDVPLGAGLSSSAAVECAVVFALNELFDFKLSKLEMVRIAQKAEHNFAGVMCGIMDQFASMFGKKDHAIKLDCDTLEYEYEPLELEGYKILLLNTNVKHSLSSSAYNERRAQCNSGVAWINKHVPSVKKLRDATIEMLDKYVFPKDELIYKRCRYVVEEIKRLTDACEDLKRKDIDAFGRKMFYTHEGLSKEYGVSCPELDFLVDAVKQDPDVPGARMMGGGFGGCTINIVKEAAIPRLIEKIGKKYKTAMHLELSAYVAQIENGTEVVLEKDGVYV